MPLLTDALPVRENSGGNFLTVFAGHRHAVIIHHIGYRIVAKLPPGFIGRCFVAQVHGLSPRRTRDRIEELLGGVNADLEDGRVSILGGTRHDYTDYAFAAFTGLWLMPQGYGGGQADDPRIERDQAPAAMRADIERWVDAYPAAVNHVEALYTLRKEGL